MWAPWALSRLPLDRCARSCWGLSLSYAIPVAGLGQCTLFHGASPLCVPWAGRHKGFMSLNARLLIVWHCGEEGSQVSQTEGVKVPWVCAWTTSLRFWAPQGTWVTVGCQGRARAFVYSVLQALELGTLKTFQIPKDVPTLLWALGEKKLLEKRVGAK